MLALYVFPLKLIADDEVTEVDPVTPAAAPPMLAKVGVLPNIVSELRAVESPIAPEMFMVPGPLLIEKAAAPSTVLDSVMTPPPALLLRVVLPANEIALRKDMPPVVVVMFAASEFDPAPVWLNEVAAVMFAPDESVKSPLLAIVTPPPVVETLLFKVKAAPVRLMPPELVVKAPNELVPAPLVCVIDPALIAAVVTLRALLMVNVDKASEPPIAPPIEILPVAPESRVKI